jgi:flagellar hook assembly protein FlgD
MYNGLNCYDVTVLQDSTIIISEGYNGIRALSYNGWIEMVNNHTIPVSYNLYQNYPNPFNPKTTISYQLPAVSDVNLVIFDIAGRRINQWSYSNQQAGAYDITWNGKDQSGKTVPSGVYIYRMMAGEFVESKKMVLLK